LRAAVAAAAAAADVSRHSVQLLGGSNNMSMSCFAHSYLFGKISGAMGSISQTK
jgi:hypothetical protein